MESGDNYYRFNFRYGFHDFYDSSIGYDNASFIRLLDTKYIKSNDENLLDIDIIDILSLQNFDKNMQEISWRVKLNYNSYLKSSNVNILGGAGLAFKKENYNIYMLGTVNAYKLKKVSVLTPGINIGIKYKFSFIPKWKPVLISEYINDLYDNENIWRQIFQTNLICSKQSLQYIAFIKSINDSEKLGVGLAWNY